MPRYIDAENIHRVLASIHGEAKSRIAMKTIEKCDYELSKIPTADVEPVRPHGKMIVKERERLIPDAPPTASVDEFGVPFIVRHHKIVKYFFCPVCKNELRDELVKYCDECGAKMDEEEEK